jgi:hypothetical protein
LLHCPIGKVNFYYFRASFSTSEEVVDGVPVSELAEKMTTPTKDINLVLDIVSKTFLFRREFMNKAETIGVILKKYPVFKIPEIVSEKYLYRNNIIKEKDR